MSKQPRKPDSTLDTLLAIGRLLLAGLGMIGLGVHLFRDDGWLAQGLSKVFESTTTMLAIPVGILLIYLANRWLTAPERGELSSRGNIPLYIMMAIGGYFVYALATTGDF